MNKKILVAYFSASGVTEKGGVGTLRSIWCGSI